ncbi:MAG TPA: type II toxin-antitoxin system HipA family toxin [Steroidobacteraceae bacterium]|nr:type II toxin-antitoxin system HipA family toxin [Steroidobacteraceae bacterium]
MSARPIKHQVQVAIGAKASPVGQLTFVRDGRREYSGFSYGQEWLRSPQRFEISPDLPLRQDFFTRRAPSDTDSPFHFALADTAPDAWGRRVIQRSHAKRRAADPTLAPLTAFDYLASVDDFSRVGALRLIDTRGQFLGSGDRYRTPQLIDLSKVASAIRKVERGTDEVADLEYLQGKATSLGGLRPKCSLLDENGALAIGKFPSVKDERSIVRAEVLALRLVAHAGSVAAVARAITVDETEIAVIRRFDRTGDGARIPYLSGGSLLQARRDEDRAYTELADAIRRIGAAPTEDLRELWRRLVINLLITNIDDHLWNVGFLYAGDGKWRLAPAFDVNPFPEKDRESKTWLSEVSGPITSLEQLLSEAAYFGFARSEAETVAGGIAMKLAEWRQLGASREIGLSEEDLVELAPAFEHKDAAAARALAH